MKKAKLIAFIILLKRHYRSGWISFHSKDNIGVSSRTFKKYFNQLKKEGFLRKGKRGYFISGFNTCLSVVYGQHSKYIRIPHKTGGLQEVTDWVLNSVAHHRIKQQYEAAKLAILDNMGRRNRNKKILDAYIKEGVKAQVRISSRQIGRFIGTSWVKANRVIRKLQSTTFIKTRFPIYPVRNTTLEKKKEYNLWQCERIVIKMKPMLKGSIIPVMDKTHVLCK